MEKIVASPLPQLYPIELSTSEDFGKTFFNGIRQNAANSSVAIVDALLNKQITYRELLAKAETLARHLSNLGCRRGDVIAICAPNSIEWIVVMTAALRIGAAVAAISSLLLTDELKHQLNLCKPMFIYTIRALGYFVCEAKGAVKPQNVIVKGGYTDCRSLESCFDESDQEQLPQLLPSFEEIGIKPHDPIFIFFSSGTTGLPKAVLLSHVNMQAWFETSCHPTTDATYPNQIVFAPFAHVVGALWTSVALTLGFTTHIMSKFDFNRYLQIVETNKIEKLFLVPTILTLLAKSPEVAKYDLRCVKSITCSSAPVSRQLEEQIIGRFPGLTLRQGYGMTETSGLVILVPYGVGRRKPGSIGVPVCNTQAKIIDVKGGTSLGPNEDGELCVRSHQVMNCYLDNPKATAETVDKNGWLHTGDNAYYDEDGYFYIIDRLKELIKYNAYQVAPAELEAVLLSHPQVADAGVFGLPDSAAGELPMACVVRREPEGGHLSENELEQFVAGKVAPYKKLRGGIKFVTSIPKTSSGKILRRELKNSILGAKL